jgi:hypothetical protein
MLYLVIIDGQTYFNDVSLGIELLILYQKGWRHVELVLDIMVQGLDLGNLSIRGEDVVSLVILNHTAVLAEDNVGY